MKTKFIVESIVTFYEMHVVEAETEEEAKKIAQQADYNASKFVGNQIVDVHKYKDEDLDRMNRIDSYVFDGYSSVDSDGYLEYYKSNGEINGNMPRDKIFWSS